MTIVGGFDVARRQITFDMLDKDTGELRTGQIVPATRARLREWVGQFDGEKLSIALERCTGWRFVAEELQTCPCRRASGRARRYGKPARVEEAGQDR